MPLTLRRVRTTARRTWRYIVEYIIYHIILLYMVFNYLTWRHATRLDSISSVVTKMQANASRMLRYSSSIMI